MKKLIGTFGLLLSLCIMSCSKDYRDLTSSYSHKVSQCSDSGLHMTFYYSDGNTPPKFIEALENGTYELTSMWVDDSQVTISDATNEFFKCTVRGRPGATPVKGQIVKITINYKSWDK